MASLKGTRDDIPYGPHPLQKLDLCVQNTSPDAPWIIYIHGGAWRDPTITKSTAHVLLRTQLHSHPTLNAATINYRLSPHPSYPTLSNTAHHPDHLSDVVAAILYLQSTYKLSQHRYTLAGHSAGATLVFQALPILGSVGLWPASVVGIEGIYDLVDLVDEYPDYSSFIEGAFGNERGVWESASPGWVGVVGWEGWGGRVVLVQSEEDELLSWRQTVGFREAVDNGRGRVTAVCAKGRHDDVPGGREVEGVLGGLVKELEGEKTAAEVRHML